MPYTIGQLASSAGVNVETVRYYERRGLISQPLRPPQGHRQYSADTLEQLLFIKRAQQLGFSLQEIATLMALGEGQCREVRSLAENKLSMVRHKIHDLQRLETVLDGLVSQCRNNVDDTSCPIVKSIQPNHDRKT